MNQEDIIFVQQLLRFSRNKTNTERHESHSGADTIVVDDFDIPFQSLEGLLN